MKERILTLLFPPKCVLCVRLLRKEETDLCANCRKTAPAFPGSKIKLSFLAQWTGMWYYKDDVRASLLRYKFRGRRNYAAAYGRLLAMKLQTEDCLNWDILTWIPISRLRKLRRGYDQVALFARVTAEELRVPLVQTLHKTRNTRPQSGMGNVAHRRANILGAYRVVCPELIRGKRILLLDDIVTTGATASECARMLLTAGAKEVKLVTLAVASHDR